MKRNDVELTNEQKCFLACEGKVVLSACPGSGKTFIVAQKLLQYIRNWNRPHQGVAVLSFTNVAKDEIEKQASEICSNGLYISYPHYVGTLDSFINNQILLRFGYLLFRKPRRPIIAIKNFFSFPYRYWRKECYRKGCVDNIHEFRWGMNGRLYRANKLVECPPNANSKNPPCYDLKKSLLKNGIVFQSDVPALSYLLLKTYPSIARALAARFPVIILDEAQDTSKEQMAVLDIISENGLDSIILVGDSDQSIYEWRNATPECFVEKMSAPGWTSRMLTVNFRSSQLICNATRAFAKTFENRLPSIAAGCCSDYHQKPILLLFEGEFENSRTLIIERFLNLCIENNIDISPDNIAVVTRSRIHKDTNIQNLWKSKEVEILAESAYEWFAGSRRKAYELCEKAMYGLCIGELSDVEISIDLSIELFMPYELWRTKIIEVLVHLPSVDLPLGEWMKRLKSIVKEAITQQNLSLRDNLSLDDVLKIKKSDKKNPAFRTIPLRRFFETKSCKDYTLSSIHGVKGETYNALLLLVESISKNTLSPSFLNKGDLDCELMRIAYVAMTRPRKLLVVCMSNIEEVNEGGEFPRFPKTDWDYQYIVI